MSTDRRALKARSLELSRLLRMTLDLRFRMTARDFLWAPPLNDINTLPGPSPHHEDLFSYLAVNGPRQPFSIFRAAYSALEIHRRKERQLNQIVIPGCILCSRSSTPGLAELKFSTSATLFFDSLGCSRVFVRSTRSTLPYHTL